VSSKKAKKMPEQKKGRQASVNLQMKGKSSEFPLRFGNRKRSEALLTRPKTDLIVAPKNPVITSVRKNT